MLKTGSLSCQGPRDHIAQHSKLYYNVPSSCRFNRFKRQIGNKLDCSNAIEGAGASGYAVKGLRPTSPKAWEIISTELQRKNLKFASGDAIEKASKNRVIVVDIRPKGEYEKSHIPESVNVEFFRLIEGLDPVKIARRAVYAFFGILNGTEFNPNFFEEIEATVGDKNKQIVVYCNIGGSLEPTGPSEFGRQSRSLTAAYELIRAGYKVQVLEGGLSQWVKEQRETSSQ